MFRGGDSTPPKTETNKKTSIKPKTKVTASLIKLEGTVKDNQNRVNKEFIQTNLSNLVSGDIDLIKSSEDVIDLEVVENENDSRIMTIKFKIAANKSYNDDGHINPNLTDPIIINVIEFKPREATNQELITEVVKQLNNKFGREIEATGESTTTPSGLTDLKIKTVLGKGEIQKIIEETKKVLNNKGQLTNIIEANLKFSSQVNETDNTKADIYVQISNNDDTKIKTAIIFTGLAPNQR